MALEPAEQISLESDYDEIRKPSEETFEKVTHQIIQVQKWKRVSVAAQILDNKFLFVQKYSNNRKVKYWVNLLFINPIPVRKKNIDLRWGLSALIMACICAALVTAEKYFQISDKFIYFPSIIILFGTLALISTLVLVYRYQDTLSYVTLGGNLTVLPLLYNNPSKAEFKSFAKVLSGRTKQLQDRTRLKNRLANELAEHRRLKDSGVISEKQYEKAKNKILSQH